MAEAHVVAHASDIPEGTHCVVKIEDREIGIFNVHGEYYALPNLCVHQGGPLCKGMVSGTVVANADTGWKLQWVFDGEIVSCPWHSLEFNITTGQCLAFPKRRLRTYPVIVENGDIKILL